MAEETNPDQVPVVFHGADGEYRFVDSAKVTRREGGTMVYIDFYQLGTTDIDAPASAVRGSARGVMLPALAENIAEQMSALRDT